MAELKGKLLEAYMAALRTAQLVKEAHQELEAQGSASGAAILPPLPGTWRPFSDNDAFWNKKISDLSFVETWFTHRHSTEIINHAKTLNVIGGSGRISFSNTYNVPIWNVDSPLLPQRIGHCNQSNVFYLWDANGDDIVDVPVPWDTAMWSEPYPGKDGHICIVDLNLNTSMEMSRFRYPCTQDSNTNHVQHTTFNIWDLAGVGYQNPLWTQVQHGQTSRGGRGGGTPAITGMIRPEEIKYAIDHGTEIRHAMGFTYSGIKGTSRDSSWHLFAHPPCCRADEPDNVNSHTADKYMTYGLRIQLNPDLPMSYFTGLGITSPGVKKIIVCLQEYGAFLHDYSGPQDTGHIKFSRQMLHPTDQTIDETLWKQKLNNDNTFFADIVKIKTQDFRVLQWANQREVLWNHNTGVVELVYQPADGPS